MCIRDRDTAAKLIEDSEQTFRIPETAE